MMAEEAGGDAPQVRGDEDCNEDSYAEFAQFTEVQFLFLDFFCLSLDFLFSVVLTRAVRGGIGYSSSWMLAAFFLSLNKIELFLIASVLELSMQDL